MQLAVTAFDSKSIVIRNGIFPFLMTMAKVITLIVVIA